ncbi:MAG: DUF4089 domain-containing protein [Burkholderiales bacterium]|nr:DUF4089 domain-containing protein [Burkholderiales bacterium]
MDRQLIEHWVDAAAPMLGLPVDEGNRGALIANLEMLAAVAGQLEAFELAPADEPLTVFRR